MIFREAARRILPKSIREAYKEWIFFEAIHRFRFQGSPAEVKADIQAKYDHQSDLLDLFTGNQGTIVHKWHHYIPLYDRYFSAFRGQPIRFLEIGVFEGGSLKMWRDYFGEQAIIFGIDINPKCKQFDGVGGQVRIGSQVDPDFLNTVIEEMGGVDLILDDGSHHMKHVPETLRLLFPRLSNGGLYMIEDLHAAYWKGFGGGFRSSANFFGTLFDIVDDVHRWYHRHRSKQAAISHVCSGIHIHDSLIVLDKNQTHPPVHSALGQPPLGT